MAVMMQEAGSKIGLNLDVRRVPADGYWANKFGWSNFGLTTAKDDADHLMAAREGLGKDGILLVDAGCVFGDDEIGRAHV